MRIIGGAGRSDPRWTLQRSASGACFLTMQFSGRPSEAAARSASRRAVGSGQGHPFKWLGPATPARSSCAGERSGRARATRSITLSQRCRVAFSVAASGRVMAHPILTSFNMAQPGELFFLQPQINLQYLAFYLENAFAWPVQPLFMAGSFLLLDRFRALNVPFILILTVFR